jgi:SAM-dependent methyltransferase
MVKPVSALVVPPPPRGSTAHRIASAINALLQPLGLKLVRKEPFSYQFISVRWVIQEAGKRNLPVREYLAKLWDHAGREKEMAERLTEFGVFESPVKKVCEIGPGTGMGLRAVLQCCRPERYEIYETARDWRDWLVQEYGILACAADGARLASTLSDSVDLVHAHGVFVCTPFLTTIGYLAEMARVTKPGGFLVFDVLTENCFPLEALQRWFDSPHRYPVFIGRQFAAEFLAGAGVDMKAAFLARHGEGQSEYLVFRKLLPDDSSRQGEAGKVSTAGQLKHA